MSEIDDLAAHDPLFAEEIEQLTPAQRQWLEEDLRLRRRAASLSRELLEDEGDVYHQLKQLRRSPTERLRLGLNHGRSRPRLVE
jgi:hypothetical protein